MMIDAHEQRVLVPAYMKAGRDTYAGRMDAWHALGDVSGKFQTLKEITTTALADFEVVKKQLDWAGVKVPAWGTFRRDTGFVGTLGDRQIKVKDSKGEVSYLTFLAPVGEGYTVIPHQSCGELLDSFVGQVGQEIGSGAWYETMGVLDFGKKVWAQINPNFQIRVGEDITDVLLTYVTSHDGSWATEIYMTVTRQVCRNTTRIGRMNKLSNSMRVKHTKNSGKRIEDFKMALDEVRGTAMDVQAKMNFLASKKVTKESMGKILDRLFPKKKTEEGEESSTRRENNLAGILALYESNDNNAFPEQAGTPYALLNAITNYTDHERSTKGDNRAVSALFGSGDKLKTSALELILAEAEGMPKNMRSMPSVQADSEVFQMLKR
jgi:phage/plasmid-like protein (TIGR03299 family)